MFEQSIVHRLVRPDGLLEDVPMVLLQHYKEVYSGTPAWVSLTSGADGNADVVDVFWNQGAVAQSDVMIIDEEQATFMEAMPYATH